MVPPGPNVDLFADDRHDERVIVFGHHLFTIYAGYLPPKEMHALIPCNLLHKDYLNHKMLN
jgi:hypothetical protein